MHGWWGRAHWRINGLDLTFQCQQGKLLWDEVKGYITRLLGRPQPQMYPPVALNQYTLVNRTHRHYIYIYASRPHKHHKITPKLNNMQNMEVIWWTFLFSFGGSWGKRMLNAEVLNCHEDIITLDTYVQQGKTMVTMAGDNKFYICENINIFGYMGARGGGGGGCLNNQTGPILVHIYPLFNNNLHVKYRSNLIRTFWVKIKKNKIKKKKSFFSGSCWAPT